jgi:putative tricarboxylic transport membrane protein
MSHDRKVSVFLILFAIGVFFKAYLIPTAKLQREVGAGAFPMFLAILLGILGIALFITAGKKKKSEAPKEAATVQSDVEEIQESKADRVKRIIKALVILAVYIATLPYLGFVVATVLFGIVYLTLLYSYKPLKSIFPAAAMALLGYLIFKVALQIPLPAFMEAIK